MLTADCFSITGSQQSPDELTGFGRRIAGGGVTVILSRLARRSCIASLSWTRERTSSPRSCCEASCNSREAARAGSLRDELPFSAFASHFIAGQQCNQRSNSERMAMTGPRPLARGRRTGKFNSRSQRWTVRTPRSRYTAISFQEFRTSLSRFG